MSDSEVEHGSTAGKRFLAIVGPTGCGKTEVCHELAKLLPCEMISCDSMQVYKDMPILTQAPVGEARGTTSPVHLTCFLDPAEEFSAARFRQEALSLMESIRSRKKLPMIVGGTGLYLRALFDGLFESGQTSKDEALRNKLMAEEQNEGTGTLHRALQSVDAKSAQRIHPHDTRRLVRALEVYHLTGRPMSAQMDARQGIRKEYGFRIFLFNRKREDLYDRIDRRVDQMMADGLIEEVRALIRRSLSQTARMALGIRQTEPVIEGRISVEEALRTLKQETRNYAKRQLSWFRHEKDVDIIDIDRSQTSTAIAREVVKRWAAALKEMESQPSR